MSTEQVVAEVKKRGKEASNRLLTDNERMLARQHAEQRDFGVMHSQTPSFARSNNSTKRVSTLTLITSISVATIMLAILAVLALQMYRRETDRSTAERELKAYATALNHELPNNNQIDITSISVQYPIGSPMEVNFSQGNAHCTAPVNPPDNQHNLYWVDRVDAVPLQNLATTRYKCVATVSLAGLGANVNNP